MFGERFPSELLLFTSFSFLPYWVTRFLPKNKKSKIDKLLRNVNITNNCLTSLSISLLLISRWLIFGYFPLTNLYESIIFLYWSLSTSGLVLENFTKLKVFGILTGSINFMVALYISFLMPVQLQLPAFLPPSLRSNWLLMHVTVTLVGYALLIFGTLSSLFPLMLTNNVRIKSLSQPSTPSSLHWKVKSSRSQLSSKFRRKMRIRRYFLNSAKGLKHKWSTSTKLLVFPNIENLKTSQLDNATHEGYYTQDTQRYRKTLKLMKSLDIFSSRTLTLGYPLLTMGIISGAMWAREAWGALWSWDPKESWALVTWLLYTAYLHSRLDSSESSQRMGTIFSFAGVACIWFGYLGLNFIGSGLHTYGQIS
jgi:cytochrome c-type biogenesis protein CcsB